MDSATPALKRGLCYPLCQEKWVACSDNKSVFNNHETQPMLSHLTLYSCLSFTGFVELSKISWKNFIYLPNFRASKDTVKLQMVTLCMT